MYWIAPKGFWVVSNLRRTNSTCCTVARPGTGGSTLPRCWCWCALLAGSHSHSTLQPPSSTLRKSEAGIKSRPRGCCAPWASVKICEMPRKNMRKVLCCLGGTETLQLTFSSACWDDHKFRPLLRRAAIPGTCQHEQRLRRPSF